MTIRTILLALALASAPAQAATKPPPAPLRFAADYDLRFLGIAVGEAHLRSERTGEGYGIELDGGLKGLAGWFFEGSGTASSRGRLGPTMAVPSEFRLDTRYSGVPLRVDMRLEGGTVRSSKVEPEPPPRPDRIPVKPGDKAGVTDPLGMLAIPLPEGPVAPGLCDRRIPVYDGGSRSDLVLSRGHVVEVSEGPFRGEALECRVRWEPVSGHRPRRPAVERMAANDGMSVRLAPAPGGWLLPLSIVVETGWGTARIEARSWESPPAR